MYLPMFLRYVLIYMKKRLGHGDRDVLHRSRDRVSDVTPVLGVDRDR